MARVNKTRYALLGFLSLGPATGYDMKIKMAKSTAHFWREGDSSIYPILKQLLEEQKVICELVNQEKGRSKKVYTISDDGQDELEEWLLDEPETFQSRNELLLKIFFGWNVEREVILEHLERFREKVSSALKQYKLLQKKAEVNDKRSVNQLHQFLTLRAGVVYSEASLTWCDEAVALLGNMGKSKWKK